MKLFLFLSFSIFVQLLSAEQLNASSDSGSGLDEQVQLREEPIIENHLTCTDKLANCQRASRYCKFAKLEATLKNNCQKTCGYCTAATNSNTACQDTNPACFNWQKNGFCTSTINTPEYKKQNCGRTCGLCT